MPKDFNKKIDDYLNNVELPSDEEIKHDTHIEKNRRGSKRFWSSAKGKALRKEIVVKTFTPEYKAKLGQSNRENYQYPFRIYFPNGTVKDYTGHDAIEKEVGKENWNRMILPSEGAKRIQRREFKNCVIHRTDIKVDQEYVKKLVKIADIKANHSRKDGVPRRKRDVKAWSEKMKKFWKTKEGKAKLKKKYDKLRGRPLLANARRIMTPKGEFASAKFASEAYGVHGCTIRDWLKRKPKEFYYLSEKGG